MISFHGFYPVFNLLGKGASKTYTHRSKCSSLSLITIHHSPFTTHTVHGRHQKQRQTNNNNLNLNNNDQTKRKDPPSPTFDPKPSNPVKKPPPSYPKPSYPRIAQKRKAIDSQSEPKYQPPPKRARGQPK